MVDDPDIDKTLLEKTLRMRKNKGRKDNVNNALKGHVMRRRRRNILSLFGKMEIEPSYDYRKERNTT